MHAFRASRGLTSFLFLFLILLPLSASFLARAPILPSRFLPTPSRCPPTGASVGKSGGEMLSNEEEVRVEERSDELKGASLTCSLREVATPDSAIVSYVIHTHTRAHTHTHTHTHTHKPPPLRLASLVAV